MSLLRERVPVFAAALWWGSLTAIGFIAVPLLFASLPNVSMAGYAAAKLFTAQAWTSLACGLVLLYSTRVEGWVLAGTLLALLIEFAVAPRIVAKQDLALWHSVGTAMYAAQWLCAAVVLWKLSRRASSPNAASASPS